MLCSEAIEDIFNRAGAPQGLFTQLPIGSSKVAELIDDARVAAVHGIHEFVNAKTIWVE
jgi:succinate-semialdehyde dehydrogenase/glutarate-semialdehyde dehydrogenase